MDNELYQTMIEGRNEYSYISLDEANGVDRNAIFTWDAFDGRIEVFPGSRPDYPDSPLHDEMLLLLEE